jgi:hypothetical protein
MLYGHRPHLGAGPAHTTEIREVPDDGVLGAWPQALIALTFSDRDRIYGARRVFGRRRLGSAPQVNIEDTMPLIRSRKIWCVRAVIEDASEYLPSDNLPEVESRQACHGSGHVTPSYGD